MHIPRPEMDRRMLETRTTRNRLKNEIERKARSVRPRHSRALGSRRPISALRPATRWSTHPPCLQHDTALPREIAMPHRATRGELASEAGAELCFFLLSAEQKLAAQVAPIATAKLSISSSSSYLPIVIRDYHPLLATSGLSVPCAVGWLLLFCTWRF